MLKGGGEGVETVVAVIMVDRAAHGFPDMFLRIEIGRTNREPDHLDAPYLIEKLLHFLGGVPGCAIAQQQDGALRIGREERF